MCIRDRYHYFLRFFTLPEAVCRRTSPKTRFWSQKYTRTKLHVQQYYSATKKTHIFFVRKTMYYYVRTVCCNTWYTLNAWWLISGIQTRKKHTPLHARSKWRTQLANMSFDQLFDLSRYKKKENSNKLNRVFGSLALFDSISPIVSFLVPRSK